MNQLLWSYLRDSSRLSGSNKVCCEVCFLSIPELLFSCQYPHHRFFYIYQKSQKIDFIADDNYDDDYDEVEDDEDGDEDDCFDTVCAICDDGGEVLW